MKSYKLRFNQFDKKEQTEIKNALSEFKTGHYISFNSFKLLLKELHGDKNAGKRQTGFCR